MTYFFVQLGSLPGGSGATRIPGRPAFLCDVFSSPGFHDIQISKFRRSFFGGATRSKAFWRIFGTLLKSNIAPEKLFSQKGK